MNMYNDAAWHTYAWNAKRAQLGCVTKQARFAIISSQEAMHKGCHVVLLYDECSLLRVKNCSTTLAAGSGAIAGSSDCVKPSACHSPGHTCTTIPPLQCPAYIVGWPLLHLACPGPLVLPEYFFIFNLFFNFILKITHPDIYLQI